MRVLRLAAAVVVIAGCGGGGDGGGPSGNPTVTSVSISPNAAQSVTVGGTVSFSAQAFDAQNSPLARTINWTTSNQAAVTLSSATGASVTATGAAAGSSQIRASVGTIQSSAVTVTVTSGGGQNPSSASVTATANNAFSPATVTIAPGGTVTWTFAALHNVTFTSSEPPGGDISDRDSGSASRTFPTAGAFPYTCTLHAGMNGTVNVQ